MLYSEITGLFHAELTGMPVYSTRVMHIKREIALCVTGHREKTIVPYKDDPENLELTKYAVRAMLDGYLTAAMKKGYTTILSGLAEGADLWAAQRVLFHKRYEKDRHIIGVMPYMKHYRGFSSKNTDLLRLVERHADFLVTTCDDPNMRYGKDYSRFTDPQIYRRRNYYMVDNSSIVIAFYNGGNSRSGTGQTLRYAKQLGRKVYSFSLDDVYQLMEKTDCDKMAMYNEMKNLKLDIPEPMI